MVSGTPVETVRAFVAVELPPEVRSILAGLVQGLRHEGLRCLRLVDPQGVHLTLKFLGSVASPRLEGVAGALDRVAAALHPFEVQVHGLGGFPTLRAPRVLWVGMGEDSLPLKEFAGAVEEALQPLGFPPEGRPFAPHLTLARVRDGTALGERRRAGEALQRLAGQEQAHLTVTSISLMRSTLGPQGARYTRLHHAPLQGAGRAA